MGIENNDNETRLILSLQLPQQAKIAMSNATHNSEVLVDVADTACRTYGAPCGRKQILLRDSGL